MLDSAREVTDGSHGRAVAAPRPPLADAAPAARWPRPPVARELAAAGGYDFTEALIDATFARAKRGGAALGLARKGKGTKIMAIADGAGLPLAVSVASASPAVTALVDDTLTARFLRRLPTRLIGEKGHDNDALDRRLAKSGIESIARHRRTRRNKTQDGRPLRHYCRRCKVERLFAWLQNNRSIVTRYERHVENDLQLACIVIPWRRSVR